MTQNNKIQEPTSSTSRRGARAAYHDVYPRDFGPWIACTVRYLPSSIQTEKFTVGRSQRRASKQPPPILSQKKKNITRNTGISEFRALSTFIFPCLQAYFLFSFFDCWVKLNTTPRRCWYFFIISRVYITKSTTSYQLFRSSLKCARPIWGASAKTTVVSL